MNNQNKQTDKTIDEIFLKYSIYKIRLKNKDLSNSDFTIKDIEYMQHFIKQIDEILAILDDEEREFITNIYINKKTKFDIPVSVSNYYYRKRKYNDILYKCLYLI